MVQYLRIMPANLTPEYLDAEKRWKAAATPEDKLDALQDMLRTIPKHKGTDKMQADIKRRIAQTRKEMQQKKGAARQKPYYHVDKEGAGTEGLRAVGRGALAGLVGGLLFTAVMVRVGILPVIAQLVGMRSTMAGLIVHLIIAGVIGVCYGLLFRRQSYDLNSALGWGVSYGFFWWILGPLTLMPILLGGTPQWTVQTAAGLFASLVGHLAYGAGLGVAFHLLEARQNPWWIARTHAEAARVARRKEQLLTSAPALWALVVAIALVLPVLLGV